MKLSDVMSSAGLTIYAEIGLVIFVVTFVAIVVHVFRKGNSTRFDEAHMRINYLESLLSQRAPNETVPARVLSLPRGSIEDVMRSNFTREEFEASVRRGASN